MTLEQKYIAFLEKNKPLIVKVATTYCYDAVDRSDLIQDILLQVWKSFPKYDETYQSSTWLYKIALNTSISFLRNVKKRDKLAEEYSQNYDLIHWQDDGLDTKLNQLHTALELLDSYDKAIVILKLDGTPEVEAAEILGISKSNYSTRLNRIKKKLSTQLKQEQDGI